MSPRTGATFTKRQKEQARQEKRQAKFQRKLQRKLEKQTGLTPSDSENTAPAAGDTTQPQPISSHSIASSNVARTQEDSRGTV